MKITLKIYLYLLTILFIGYGFSKDITFAKNIIMDETTITKANNYFINKNINEKFKGKKFHITEIPFILGNNITNVKYNGSSVYVSMLNYLKNNKDNPVLKKEIIKLWNNYVSSFKYILINNDYNQCYDVYNYYQKIDNINLLYSNEIKYKGYNFINKINDYYLGKTIICAYNYIFPNGYKLEKLKTNYIPYRYKNITMVINKNFIKILKPGDIFSTVDEILRNKKYKFVNGKAIVEGKVKEIEAGGVCGISTILYQAIVKHLPHFDIIERRPHSAWYNYLYGKVLGLDSTIYDMKGATINLKFKNKGNTTIVLQGYNKKIKKYWFEYGIKIFTPYLKNSYIKTGKLEKKETKQIHKYKDKKTGEEKEKKIVYKCIDNYIYDSNNNKLLKKVKSCYKFLNEEF